MQKIRVIIGVLLVMVFMSIICSCKSSKQILQTRTDSVYIEKLVPYIQPKDSTEVRALLECNEYGQIVLKWLDLANSKNAQLQFKIDSLGNLEAKTIVIRDTVYGKETIKEVAKEIYIEIPAKLNRWEKFKMDVGGWAIGGIIITTLLYIFKFIRKK